jgi:hypothetical protein
LDAVVAVSEVIHWLELFVDDSDAGFVGSAYNSLDIGGGFAHIGKLLVDFLRSFDGSLGMEFSCNS